MADASARSRSWTTSQVEYLMEHAGKVPRDQIAEALGRSSGSVSYMAAALRKRGVRVSLRCYERKLEWCPWCARWRTRVYRRKGMCRVCRLRERLWAAEGRCREALELLDGRSRERFARAEPWRGSTFPPMPQAPAADSRDLYERMEAEERRAAEVEEWEIRCVQMRIDAEKSRLSRIRAVYRLSE